MRSFALFLSFLVGLSSPPSYALGSQEADSYTKETAPGMQLSRKRKDPPAAASLRDDIDPTRLALYASAYRNTHPEQFGGAIIAAEHPKRLCQAAEILKQDAQELFGEVYVDARLADASTALMETVERYPAAPYRNDKPTRAAIARKINAFEEVRAPFSQDLRENAEQEGISLRLIRREATHCLSLSDLASSQPWVDSQETQSMTQEYGSQSTVLIEDPSGQ